MRSNGKSRFSNRLLAAAVLLGVIGPSVWAFDETPAPQQKLAFLDGRETAGRITEINKDGRVRLAGRTETIPLNALRQIQTGHSAASSNATSVKLRLAADGVILAKSVTIKDEKFLIRWRSGPDLTLPLEGVRSVLFDAKPGSLFQKTSASPSTDFDQLIVRLRGKLRIVRGLIESMDAKQAVVSSENRKFTVARNQIHGVVFAHVKKPFDRRGLCHVHLADGAVLPGRNPQLAAKSGKLQLRLISGGVLSVAWNSVTRITIKSERLQYLSELKPVEVVEQSIVALPHKWKKDRSVSGRPLSLAGTRYQKGIGVHARSQLTFAADGKYETLAAVIGLDDSAGRKGDCNFVVLGDGRELFRKRIRGRDKPLAIRVDVRGVRRLTLLVEPGKNLDIADHANWCDARLVRPAK